MASLSSVVGWSSSLCVAHGCSVLLRSSALSHRASRCLASNCRPLTPFCCLDWFCNNRNKKRGEIGDKVFDYMSSDYIVIEAYRTLRDRGPYPAAQVVRNFQDKFAFIPFDSGSKTVFITVDADGCIFFFWGADTDENIILTDEKKVVTKSYGTSSTLFPKRFFFTTSGDLNNFEHPLNEVKSVSRVDSSGQVCGATFKMDEAKKKSTGMSRIGSAANWSNNI
ncbi:uncharacterized protein LOC130939468 [Arachis stenosperma]|uniref:uncharacterized protein LOC130939468 n=1 Tax=Arachis stenosperma TaxID=217475 RepID=UPI0025AC0790|nr:uncharacterized protein LOC130939468 [Arachis stenosperma]